MKSILKRNRILAVIALIGLLASLVPLISRVQAEESNKYYDIVLDYNSMRSMARQSSQSEDEWLDLFKSLGVDKVALSEASALNLHDNAAIPVHAMTVKKAAESYGWEDQYPAEVAQWLRESTDVSDAIIWTETAASYEWILNAFEARFEDFEAKTYLEGEHGFIFIQQQKNGMKGEKLLDLRLGIWPDTVELFERHGYQIIPRSVTEKNMNGTKFAEAYIEVLKHFNAPYFMNNGDELVGYEDDESLGLLTQYLNESGASIAMMEQNDQSQNLVWPGVEELLDNTGYRGVRVFNEWAYIQNRYQYCGYEGPEEITNTFFRAIAERNCKIIFLKMILEPDTDVSWDADEKEWVYITDPADYEQMLTDLDARLEPLGYTHATVPAMELKAPSMVLKVLQGIGTAALIVILLDLFFFIGKRWRTILFAVGALGLAGLAVLKPSMFRLILSMSGGIVMPSIAAVGLCRVLLEKRRSEPQIKFGKLLVWDCYAWSAWQFFQVKDRKGNYRDIPGNWNQYAGYFPLWRLSYSIIPYIRMKFEQNGLGFQNLYNIPQGVEVPWLTYQQFSNLIGNVTDMVIAEQNWQPMIDAIWENRTVEDYETTGSTVKIDFMRKWHHNRSGMNIGRDMVGTMTNTLILAFFGSSFTLILYLYFLCFLLQGLLY